MPFESVPGTSLHYHLINFDEFGNERYETDNTKMSQTVIKILAEEPITDVFIICHGWLGDIPAARKQYNKWIAAMAANTSDIEKLKEVRQNFNPLLIGLHWPSLPLGDEEVEDTSESVAVQEVSPIEQLVEKYAERIANTEAAKQSLRTVFSSSLKNAAPDTLPPEVSEAYGILNQEASLNAEGEGAAPGLDHESFDPESIFQDAKKDPTSYGDLGWGSLLAPLRTLSFWTMKDRARQFGESGGFQLLTRLQQVTSNDVRFHLMGHSFGCIVVSATLAGSIVRPVTSVALVQGALSLWSYCSDIPKAPGLAGYFRSVVADRKKVAGPIITTQSDHDTAVGKMYPPGAWSAGQVAFPVKSDGSFDFPKYGGLGTWGARGPGLEIVDMKMLPVDGSYNFEAGKIYNLNGSKFINDKTGGGLGGAHSDIAKPEVAHAVWQAAIGG